ncbi:DMT family transporter [Parasalinivibrio latis]|uniref:DMT family transporter n=1 Tax=Parasalinivibrio latis TaxID=2952610 RepID=UPI0030E34238
MSADNQQDGRQITTGIIYALIGTFLFSAKPVLIKLAYQAGGDAVAIMALRAGSSVPLYLIILLWLCRFPDNRQKLRKHGLKAAAIGILGYYLASYLDIEALAYISAQLERLIIFLFPSFVVLLSWLYMKQKPAPGVVSAVVGGYIGIAFIVVHDVGNPGLNVGLGSGLALLSAFIFAHYLIFSKQAITRMGSLLFTCVGMGSAGLVILTQATFSDFDVTVMSGDFIALGVAIGIFCTVLPSFLIAAGMARLSATQLSLASNVGPAITAALAVLVLGEAFTLYHAIGMTLVVFSVVRMSRKKPQPEEGNGVTGSPAVMKKEKTAE